MPCSLLASALAGAWPWIFDKMIQVFTGEDFWFTMGAKRFADTYPLTCWTGPAMRETFHQVYEVIGDKARTDARCLKYGKLAASFAVIVGHVVPFMGAQTTIMQRFFLPHPLDTIISQPFGMTEDLVSMAMAEAISDPVLASWSLTALIVLFNLARGLIFSGRSPDEEANIGNFTNATLERNVEESTATESNHQCITPAEPKTKTPSEHTVCVYVAALQSKRLARSSKSNLGSSVPEKRDWAAVASAVSNLLVGVAIAFIVGGGLSIKVAFGVVAVQMLVQLLLVPSVMGCAEAEDGEETPMD